MQGILFERAKAEGVKVASFEDYITEAPVIISLFDYSGAWSEPYRRAGFRVIQIDIKLGFDVLQWNYKAIRKDLVKGILAAPPCTDFAVSGAQYWKAKDDDGRTAQSVALVRRTLDIVEHFNPVFWALENPIGRINELVPELGMPWFWQPYMYGDAWTKKTALYGRFNIPTPCNIVEPLVYNSQGSWLQSLGGNSERTKELRSITPKGFARAFFEANSLQETKNVNAACAIA